jgi:hypothetical protein
MVLLGSGQNYGCPSCQNMVPANNIMEDALKTVRDVLDDPDKLYDWLNR